MEPSPNSDMNQPDTFGVQNGDGKNEPVLFSDEINLRVVASFTLVLGIIASGILAFTIIYVTIPGEFSFQDKVVFDPWGLAVTAFTLFASIASWAFLRVISNISESLKKLVG
jgi:hypothetical protein